jgi:methyl-accepting chemotaxis protein
MQLDELTQQNAALVEEASAASQAMADQARGLNASMARYRAGDARDAGEAGNAAAVVPAPAIAAPGTAATATAVERRKSSRPWSGRAAAAPAATAAPAPAKRAASSNDDAVWKEF